MQGRSSSLTLIPANLPSNELGYTNYVYISTSNYSTLVQANQMKKPVYVSIKGYIFIVEGDKRVEENQIALGRFPRTYMKLSFTDNVTVSLYKPEADIILGRLLVEVVLGKSFTNKRLEVEDTALEKSLRQSFKGQFLTAGQSVLIDYGNNILILNILESSKIDVNEGKPVHEQTPGLFFEETSIEFKCQPNDQFTLRSASGTVTQSLFKEDFDFKNLGVGGLDKEISDIFRKAFLKRRFAPSVLRKFGSSHAKGLLLYGPPGTGKTLIARQLAMALKSKEPKIVNGPELFDKFVGETERKIRELFSEAVADQKKLGDDSPLHIIVFDEFDALVKKRGTVNNAGVTDSAVNMLLSMIDGVNALNNILVIGMTNRKDMIDPAILRPGRFGIHVEVSLPDEKGRVQILQIHTKEMTKNNLLGPDVNLEKIAKITKNYTGAELKEVVETATTHAFARATNMTDFSKAVTINDDCKLEHNDFMMAVEEVKPQFGVDTDKLEALIRNKIIDCGPRFKKNQDLLVNMINQIKFGKSSQLLSVLIEGDNGTGKSALAAWAALESEFSFVKLVSAENFVGYHETGKIDAIVSIFNDAYRSQQSLIILDDIERIMEYVNIGPRFSNAILQALMVLIKKVPTKPEHRLLIIGTTSQKTVLKELEIYQAFNVAVHMPTLTRDEVLAVLKHYKGNAKEKEMIADSMQFMTMKRLLLLIDMACQGEDVITYDRFMQCYDECGKDEF